jgi:hypothetical protein
VSDLQNELLELRSAKDSEAKLHSLEKGILTMSFLFALGFFNALQRNLF